MKRHLSTIVMVVIALALGAYLWADRNHGTTGEQKARANNAFPIWRKDEVREVSIVHDGETLVLVKKDGVWRMRSPHDELADAAAVERLLGTLEYATISRRATEGPGLDAPRATGAIAMRGLTTRFALGADSPRPEGSAYLRIDDAAPIVVGRELVQALMQSCDTFRDRTVVPYLATELSRFEVKGRFVLERLDDRTFKTAGVLASRAAVDRMWAALAEMRAESFPKDADVANPVLTIVLTPKDGRPPSEIAIGNACPGQPNDVLVLRRTPTRIAACAPKDIVGRLSPSDDALLERRPFTLHADEMEELRIERIGSPLLPGASASAPAKIEIARKGTGFHERAPDDRELTPFESDAATEVLKRLDGAEAERVTRGGPAFTAAARARITSGDRDETIELATPDAQGHVMLRRTLDDARLEAGPVLARLLVPRLTTLRPHSIVENEERRPARVQLRCGVEQELLDRGAGFRMITPKGYEADGTIAQLVDAILKGRVDPWIADSDDGSFGFAEKGCQVVIGFEDEKAPLTVWFGGAGEGGIYGRVDTRAGVFVAPPSLRELAGRIFVSRAALRTPASQIESVRITQGGHPVTDPSFRDAVGALVADRVVALGTKGLGAPDLVIDLALSEGGPPRHIACAAPTALVPGGPPAERLCTVSGVDATFGVALNRFTTLERDGGAR